MAEQTYDVLVIGSGATGGFAAKELTERGLKVMVLEAGPDITQADFKPSRPHRRNSGLALRDRIRATLGGRHTQSRAVFFRRQFGNFYVNDRNNPYTTDRDAPFLWFRGRQLGGRLHTFGRVLLRWTDHDFKGASRDGQGVDWPISYADLEPYYDQVERCLGIYGNMDGVEALPDGRYVGPAKLTPGETAFRDALQGRWPDRHAVSWRYMAPSVKRVPLPLLAARDTGNLTIRGNAVVRRITSDPLTGRATGAEFIDRVTRQPQWVGARSVVVCGSAIESIRLLLNSKAERHPDGLGNSSGLLGHYFMDQCPSLIAGTSPAMTGWMLDDSAPKDPIYSPSGGIFLPRFENFGAQQNASFFRGYSYQGSIGRQPVAEDQPAQLSFFGFGEMLPYYDNRISLDPKRSDAWGIPVAHIRCVMHENEQAMLRAQTREIIEMIEQCGGTVEFCGSPLGLREFGRGAFPDAHPLVRLMFRLWFKKTMVMGAAIHESGGARMGTNLGNSVLNAHNQSWDVNNLFVTDASAFPSGGTSGTTLTAMAMTVRACAYLAKELEAGRL